MQCLSMLCNAGKMRHDKLLFLDSPYLYDLILLYIRKSVLCYFSSLLSFQRFLVHSYNLDVIQVYY